MSKPNKLQSVRAHALNLVIIFAVLAVGFGCFCGGDNRPRVGSSSGTSANSSGSAVKNGNAAKKSSKKGNTKAAETAKKSIEPDKGDFLVEYDEVEDARYEKINEQLRDQKLLEKAATDLNKNLALPHDITLVTRDCGEINAYYRKADRKVTICYEIMDFYYNLFRRGDNEEREATQKMFDAMQFIFLHEVGHALIDAYGLPIAGNEEDAADRLSSYINLKELDDKGSRAAIAAAEAFDLQSKSQDAKELPFYDEHSLDQQRFYNILCQLYGSNESKYEVLVTKNLLPEQRAVRCPNEFQQNVRTWETLLKQYRRQ